MGRDPGDLTPTVTAFHEAAEWTGVTDKDREKWLELRRTMVTASDVAAIFGEGEHESQDAYRVYVDKVAERKEPERITIEDARFWGRLEQPILTLAAEYYGWNYRPGGALLRSRKHAILGATLDAEVDRGDGVWIDLEGKTTRMMRDWNEEEGDLPVHVLIQVQAQLLVTGAPLALVFALLQGSRPCRVEVAPSPEFHAIIVEETERFMDLVTRREPPTPTHKSTKALNRLYPRGDGTMVSLPSESVEWTRELQEIAKQQKVLESRYEELRNLLKDAIGSSTIGILPEEVGEKKLWRWQLQANPGYTVEPYESRVLLAMKDPGRVKKATRRAAPPALRARPESLAESETVTRFRTTRRRSRR